MEYNNIIALVPQGEDFDITAVNEGIWLSQGHMDNIEKALSDDTAAKADHALQIQQSVNEKQTLEASLEVANQSIASNNIRIGELEAEVATLKKGAAGSMQSTAKEVDDMNDSATSEKMDETTKEAKRLRALRDGK